MRKFFFILFTIIIIGVILIDQRDKLTFVPSFILSPTPANPIAQLVLGNLPVWLPNTTWSPATFNSMNTYYGSVSGQNMTTTVTSENPKIDHFEDTDLLNTNGFSLDPNLSADGSGSSSWGYKKFANGLTQIVIFSYSTIPTVVKPNQPVIFQCPCKTIITAFVSNPF